MTSILKLLSPFTRKASGIKINLTGLIKKKLLTPGLLRLFKESTLVGFTEYATLGALFLANIFVNRFYGNDELGVFSLCYAIAQIAIVGTGSAFSAILRRDVSLIQKANDIYIRNINQLKIGLLLFCFLLLFSSTFFNIVSFDRLFYCIALVLVAKGLDLLSETYYTTYQSIGLYKHYAVLKLANAALFILGVVICCLFHFPADFIYFSMPVSAFIAYFINLIVYKRLTDQNGNPAEQEKRKGQKKYLLAEAWPLMLNTLFFQLSSRLNVIIIFWLTSHATVALFSAGVMGVTVFTAASNALAIVLFPGLNKEYNMEPAMFFKKTTKLMMMLFLIGAAVALVFYITIPLQIKVIGSLPESAPVVFKIFSLFIPFGFATAALGYSFIIIKKQQLGLLISLVVMIMNAGSFYYLTKYYHQFGMAWAYAASGLFQLFLIYAVLYLVLRKKHPEA